MPDFAKQRKRMVEIQLSQRGIRDPHALAAMGKVPRERFLQEGLEEFAYEDAVRQIWPLMGFALRDRLDREGK